MLLSFLTPTYNRGYILKQLYDSLCRQSKKNFEWIIVDDGSTDNTEDLVEVWKQEASFPIQYRKKENGGKHRALNVGFSLINTLYTCIIDSDDYLTDYAAERIEQWIMEIDNFPQCAGVAGTRRTPNGDLVGQYPKEKKYVDATNIVRRKEKLEGDQAEVYRTSILKAHPFPEFEQEKFLSECAVWDRIGLEGYWLRWYPDSLIVCEYRDDGLTKTKNKEARNYQGYTFVLCQQLLYEPYWKKLGLIEQYCRVTKQRGGNDRMVCKNLHVTYPEIILARTVKWIHRKIKKIVKNNG